MKKVLSFSAVILLFLSSCSDQNADVAPSVHLKSTGTDHGYFYQCYVSSGSGSISFPQAGTYAGNFAANWSNVGDIVAGKGWNPGSSSRTINYNCGSLTGSYNFFGVYGWTTNPLIEYYVCELGSVTYAATYIGSVTSDGHSYGVYKHQQVNQPSIQGTATFWQYLSQWGGSSTGSNHAVTMSNHWNYWSSHIGAMGSPNLQILAVEAYSNKSGYCNATVW
ncbi:MAG TPA: glycoside hydrolase family 11 protein [Cyclobacteriaceae bacterium]|jgi:endo-1,4-beta-xylanase|nr:glycoside hydrolase family 11 protein [Cyclobacteriaceae bacterium]